MLHNALATLLDIAIVITLFGLFWTCVRIVGSFIGVWDE